MPTLNFILNKIKINNPVKIIKDAQTIHHTLDATQISSHKMVKDKHFYCFIIPPVKNPPVPEYGQFVGRLVSTLAVSPQQAANNAIYSTFQPPLGDKFRVITKYIHDVHDLPQLVLDIDELDTPIQQQGLFGGKTSSHRRRDKTRLAKLISKRYNISNEGENSAPRKITRDFVNYRRKHPLNQ